MILSVLAAFALATNATPAEIVGSCRAMIPANVELDGRILLRNRRGIVQAEHAYTLVRKAGVTTLTVDGKRLEPPTSQPPTPNPQPSTPNPQPSTPNPQPSTILGTDVTWSDLTLDYLWWDEFAFDEHPEEESVHGQKCLVLLLRKGARTVRAWVDRKTGALMQAEEIADGRAVRRLWGTRIRKFGDRWMANVLEVETLGSGHRTKITVEELK